MIVDSSAVLAFARTHIGADLDQSRRLVQQRALEGAAWASGGLGLRRKLGHGNAGGRLRMEIPKNELEQVRARYEARKDKSLKFHLAEWVRKIDRDASERLGNAVRDFVAGGSLQEFAESYRPLFARGWDGDLVRDFAENLASDEAFVDQLRGLVGLPSGHEDAASRVDRFAEMLSHRQEAQYLAQMMLSVCWHSQAPEQWQFFTRSWLKSLRSVAPSVC